jgi:hypothetical protein
MTDDDINARQRRAAQLREQIKRLKRGTQPVPAPVGGVDTPAKGPDRQGQSISPRDFIHKRMRELDSKRRK